MARVPYLGGWQHDRHKQAAEENETPQSVLRQRKNLPTTENSGELSQPDGDSAYHIVTAARWFVTQSDVALIVDGLCVGEFVR